MSGGAIFGHKSTKAETYGDEKWANDLNQFLNRFDRAPALDQSPCHIPSSQSFTTLQIRSQLRKKKVRTAAGWDCINSQVIRTCAEQLF